MAASPAAVPATGPGPGFSGCSGPAGGHGRGGRQPRRGDRGRLPDHGRRSCRIDRCRPSGVGRATGQPAAGDPRSSTAWAVIAWSPRSARRSGDVVVTGLSMSDVDATMIRVLLIFGVVTVIAVAAATTAGIVIIRRALAPLRRVAQTAGEVVDLPLDRGEVALPVRVLESDANPRTEVGQLGLRAQPDARPHRRRVVYPAGQRDAGAAIRRRRQPRAAHPVGRHPWLHRTGPTRRRRHRRGGACDEPRAVRNRANDPPRGGPTAAGPLGLRAPAGTRIGGPFAGGGRRGQRCARRRSGPSVGARSARRAGDRSSATRPGCIRC